MTYIPNSADMVSVEDSRRILHAIFPNYPELKPCPAAPVLEPIAPSLVNTPIAACQAIARTFAAAADISDDVMHDPGLIRELSLCGRKPRISLTLIRTLARINVQ
jgi:hypothetical protein